MSGRSTGVDLQGEPFVGRDGLDRRRALVLDLHLRGMQQHAIAAILKVHRNTVTNDLKAVRRRQAEAVKRLDSDEEAGATLDYYKKLRDDAYGQYLETQSAGAKLGFLQAALRAQEMYAKLLMDIGAIDKTPAKVATTHEGSIAVDHRISNASTDDLMSRRKSLIGEFGLDRGTKDN